MPKKAPPVVEEEEEITCPVCGKPVGLDVASCPYCGAEFEEEDEEAPAEEEPQEAAEEAPATAEASVDEEDTAECPVCGKSVSLAVSSCPYCGAEFEEEEVEEVIEVEEKAPVEQEPEEVQEEAAPVARAPREEVVEEVEEEPEYAKTETASAAHAPLISLKVIGISLIVLGIIGSQISVMIDWYWTWVPPIQNNLVMFVAIPLVLIIAGIAVFMLVRRSMSSGKKIRRGLPSASMSVLVFGVMAMVTVLLWKPINSALQNSSVTVAGAFFAVLVIGILVVFMGSRMTARATA